MSSGNTQSVDWINSVIHADSTESMSRDSSRTPSEGRATPTGPGDYSRSDEIGSEGVLVFIDGSVAAGKTALLKSILHHSEQLFGPTRAVDVFFESVNDDFLRQFLADRAAHAFNFQLHMAQNRCVVLSKAHSLVARGHIVFIDRSLAGDLTFTALNHADGFIDDKQYKLYQSVLSYAHPRFVPFQLTELWNIRAEITEGDCENGMFHIDDICDPDERTLGVHEYREPHVCNYRDNEKAELRRSHCRRAFIYLSVCPDVALKRLRSRGHEQEASAYSRSFLEKLDAQYCAVLDAFRRHGASVVHIDNNSDSDVDKKSGLLPLEHVKLIWKQIEFAIE